MSYLLREDGGYILREDGGRIEREKKAPDAPELVDHGGGGRMPQRFRIHRPVNDDEEAIRLVIHAWLQIKH